MGAYHTLPIRDDVSYECDGIIYWPNEHEPEEPQGASEKRMRTTRKEKMNRLALFGVGVYFAYPQLR